VPKTPSRALAKLTSQRVMKDRKRHPSLLELYGIIAVKLDAVHEATHHERVIPDRNRDRSVNSRERRRARYAGVLRPPHHLSDQQRRRHRDRTIGSYHESTAITLHAPRFRPPVIAASQRHDLVHLCAVSDADDVREFACRLADGSSLPS
jgi:hypothetical protein